MLNTEEVLQNERVRYPFGRTTNFNVNGKDAEPISDRSLLGFMKSQPRASKVARQKAEQEQRQKISLKLKRPALNPLIEPEVPEFSLDGPVQLDFDPAPVQKEETESSFDLLTDKPSTEPTLILQSTPQAHESSTLPIGISHLLSHDKPKMGQRRLGEHDIERISNFALLVNELKGER